VSEEPGGWTPTFPGQRRPFEPGNEVAQRHGAYSPRRVDPLAKEIRSSVLADPSTEYLAAARYAPAVWAWARAEAQTQLLSEYLEQAGAVTVDGVGDLADDAVRSAYLLLHRAEARAQSGRRQLGLDPLSAARLGRDKAAGQLDTARLMAELHRQEQEGGKREGPDRVDAERVDEEEAL